MYFALKNNGKVANILSTFSFNIIFQSEASNKNVCHIMRHCFPTNCQGIVVAVSSHNVVIRLAKTSYLLQILSVTVLICQNSK